ncbi:MFS transporter [Photobacterium minamisatsumaniensis]|uniref:MFS transporter n=1 Tax=Photobacterium minamisatsumaniensis TaxID=2910233 RepID=UPI003D0F219A
MTSIATVSFSEKPQITNSLLFLMATAVSATVANLYYNQPILPLIGKELGIGGDALGAIPAASQFGYAAALLFISPLGDSIARKRLIGILSLCLITALICAFSANNFLVLIGACFAIGLSANITQQLIPFAASLSTPEQKGRVIGTLMSGLTIGILLSRTASGYIGEHFGWRAVFMMSACIAALFTALLMRFLPTNQPTNRIPYSKLLLSMFGLIRQYGLLRKSALTGALWFAAFNVLWATLALHVSGDPFNFDAQQAGLFGIVALAGVSGAKFSGMWVSKVGSRMMITIALSLIAIGFLVSGLYGDSLVGLIIGIILIDFGVFSAQVSNQVAVFSIDPSAQSRINGIYMLGYYLGGALGSLVGVKVFDHFGWFGVSVLSLILVSAAMVVNCRKR